MSMRPSSEILFSFVVVLTLLLMMFVGVVVKMPHRSAGAPQPPELSSPVTPPPRLVRRPQAAGLADAGGRSARAGYRARHARALMPEPMVASARQVSGHPPWEPAPKPPGRRRSARVAAASIASGGRAGTHRQAGRHGAHRVGMSTGREPRSAGLTGRHRAGVSGFATRRTRATD